MANTQHKEEVPQGHNILDLSFALSHVAGNTSVIYRAGHIKQSKKDRSFLATTNSIADQWDEPALVGQVVEGTTQVECLAQVVTEHHQYLFNTAFNTVRMCYRHIGGMWGEYRVISPRHTADHNLAATSIGPEDQLLVYCWINKPVNGVDRLVLTELSRPSGGDWTHQDIPVGNDSSTANRRLAVARKGNETYLIYKLDDDGIRLRPRGVDGKWLGTGESDAFGPGDAGIRSETPISIVAIHPHIPDGEDVLLPSYGIMVESSYSCTGGVDVPKLPEIEDRFPGAGGFAITYMDEYNTVQVIKVTKTGATLGYPERVSRINSKAANRFVHGTKTLLAFSEVAPQELIINAAITRELFLQAFRESSYWLKERNSLAKQLETDSKSLNDCAVPDYIRMVSQNHHTEIRFRLAAEEWKKSYLVAVKAQIDAINARNKLISATLVSRVETIKTEARRLRADGHPTLNTPILPVQ
ncbi:hypothetical protein Q9L58_008310 [Maublancomyces gigas]|uniref:Uncharacterized protein n=1 Tax=Discina gigas TaxID=1032678 RepID=A0ABR3GA09_9PEZI